MKHSAGASRPRRFGDIMKQNIFEACAAAVMAELEDWFPKQLQEIRDKGDRLDYLEIYIRGRIENAYEDFE